MNYFVDWTWANSLRSLAIFEAAGLSMGFELNALPPVGHRFTGRDYIEPPPEYRERVILAFEAARAGELLPTGRTAERDKRFDPAAEFESGQLWEIDPADFRRWCDAEGLPVPAEWLPRGYAPATDTATPAPVVTVGAAGDVEPAAVSGWSLKTSIKRAPGYRWPLYLALKAAHIAGQPRPKARDVLDIWKLNPPPDIQVMPDGVKYNNGLGNPKEADLKAIGQAIKYLLTP